MRSIIHAAAVTGLVAMASVTAAQADTVTYRIGPKQADGVVPKFAVIHRTPRQAFSTSTASFPPTWTFTYSYGGKSFHETLVGTNPASSAGVTVPVYIVPVKLVLGSTVEDPTVATQNGVSIVQNIVNSPIFQSSVDFNQGGTDLGTTQYTDAFQRATLWGVAGVNPGYHLMLGNPVIKPVQTLKVPLTRGVTGKVGGTTGIVASINWFDAKVQALISKLAIPANALPLFVTTGTYLSSNATASGCCIGGYHTVSAAGQPYSHTTYIANPTAFAGDVSALSHELGEWADDPLTNNAVPSKCGSGASLEVGDPLEGLPHFGAYTYAVNGVNWHLQDMVLLTYFGVPASTSVNGWTTFQGQSIPFCSKGG